MGVHLCKSVPVQAAQITPQAIAQAAQIQAALQALPANAYTHGLLTVAPYTDPRHSHPHPNTFYPPQAQLVQMHMPGVRSDGHSRSLDGHAPVTEPAPQPIQLGVRPPALVPTTQSSTISNDRLRYGRCSNSRGSWLSRWVVGTTPAMIFFSYPYCPTIRGTD